MAKNREFYKCEKCGFETPNWMGKCSNCGSWNSLVETKSKSNHKQEPDFDNITTPHPLTKINFNERTRMVSGIEELDRVLGGGVVAGSLSLLGGAPGIGKSTLILQVASLFSNTYGKVLYVSGEESCRQIKIRADRLQVVNDKLMVLAETAFEKIESLLTNKDKYQMVIIDSIQTVYDSRLDTSPGSISQVKEITNRLLKIAKTTEVPVILIGHVTKEGELAGPRVLEHLVDVVLQIEGDRNYSYRILRAIKNRYGSTNEIGVFKMENSGMEEVKNPSHLFLQKRDYDVSGSVIVPIIEGTRTILVEVQALVSAATFSSPQRVTTGVDNKRISILLAVLEKKANFSFQSRDVYLNITGGLKVKEPALDLAMITSIISSLRDYSLPSKLAVVGEVGLAGEIRAVSQIEKRIKELKKMGFNQIIIPSGNLDSISFDPEIDIKSVKDIKEVLELIFS